MGKQIFKNGCVEIPVTEVGRRYELSTAKLGNIRVEKVNSTDPDGKEVDAKMVIEIPIGLAKFYMKSQTYSELDWAAIADEKTVWGFIAQGNHTIKANEKNTFLYRNKDIATAGKLGNEITIDFDDAKIGGAG